VTRKGVFFGAMTQVKKQSRKSYLRPIIGLAAISLLICGLFFPLLITGIAQIAIPYQANGSLASLAPTGRVVGSYLIDNNFTKPIFFHARNESNVLQASASRVDPDINLTEAYDQVPRISNATGIPQGYLMNIINSNKEGTFWIFGSPYVNVLRLNLILIRDFPRVYSGYSS
jgi:K+-transporting ATPase ATPase C chain